MKKPKRRRSNPNTVYDDRGKKFVKASSRKAAQMIARVIGGTVGKPKGNPKKGALVFRTKTAAKKYAQRNGLKRFSLKKVARAKR